MTDSVSPRPPLAFDGPAARSDRNRAFRTASRHSRTVKVLRHAMVAGAAGLMAAIAGTVIFDPFHRMPAGVSIEDVTLNGTKVTMSRPKLSGFRQDGRPYEIFASSAVQDVKVPNMFELHDMDARLTMADKTVTRVTAKAGTYDSTAEHMALTSAVEISNQAGLAVHAQDAVVEFKAGTVVTRNPVSVAIKGSTITADGMVIQDGGKQVTFEGHVHTVVLPDDAVPAAIAAIPAGTAANATATTAGGNAP